jgi:hypothetical protein
MDCMTLVIKALKIKIIEMIIKSYESKDAQSADLGFQLFTV